MKGAEWFDPSRYPTARFETTGFRALGGDRYEATGRLRIKTTTVPVVLPFTFRETGGVAAVDGGWSWTARRWTWAWSRTRPGTGCRR